ncbi:hypothetical protein Goarm_012756, partial [Gossypium armourianum]|nr:hypothetical protein [Gossypium armourianum]
KHGVSGVKADFVIAKLDFDFSHHVEAVGFFGGIWISWKDNIFVDILDNHSQFILLKISGNSYRQPVLEALKYIVLVDRTPWLAIGNFNAILASCEKRCGRVIGKRCALFSEFMDSMGLHDLGFSGFSNFDKKNWEFLGDMSTTHATFTDQVKLEIREELESVLHHKEHLLRQKARCDWLEAINFYKNLYGEKSRRTGSLGCG